jgi:hypothetical protein
MNPATLDENPSRLLGALTLAAARRLGDTMCLDADNRFRMWRIARWRRSWRAARRTVSLFRPFGK